MDAESGSASGNLNAEPVSTSGKKRRKASASGNAESGSTTGTKRRKVLKVRFEEMALQFTFTKSGLKEFTYVLLGPASGSGKKCQSKASKVEEAKAAKQLRKALAEERGTPLPGGTAGEFQRFIDRARENGTPGVYCPLSLGRGPDGAILQLAASSDREDYACIDLRDRGFPTQDGARDMATVHTLVARILSHAKGGVSDLGPYEGWMRAVKGPEDGHIYRFPCPRLRQKFEPLTQARKDSEADRAALDGLRSPFCDNFVLLVRDPDSDGKEPLKDALKATHRLCKFLGWQNGKKAAFTSKYYVKPAKRDGGGGAEAGYAIKVSVADVPIKEVFAARDLICTATSEENKETLQDKDVSHVTTAPLIDELKAKHDGCKLFDDEDSNADGSSLRKALKTAARCVIAFRDIDVTQDEPGTGNYPLLRELFGKEGYKVRKISEAKIGLNGLKTDMMSVSGASRSATKPESHSVMVYGKEIETIQQPGASTDHSLDSKLHMVPNASTTGLRRRFEHPSYQRNGITRLELTFAGDRWTAKGMLELFARAQATVQRGLVTKSTHDHFADLELYATQTVAVFIPAVHDYKKQKRQDIDRSLTVRELSIECDKVDSVPEGMIVHYSTSTTGKSVGRRIQTDVNVLKGSDGFSKFALSLANETPCNIPIAMIVVADGFKEFMQGSSPVFWARVCTINTVCNKVGGERMLVSRQPCRGLGLPVEVDVLSACGVDAEKLDHFKIAVSKERPTYDSTGMLLRIHGYPAASFDALFPMRTYKGRGALSTLPRELVKVRLSERRSKLGRPCRDSDVPLTFQYQGDWIRVPDQHQKAIRSWRDKQPDKDSCYLFVRYIGEEDEPEREELTRFEFQFPDTCASESVSCECARRDEPGTVCVRGTARKDIPVKDAPMRIIALRRRKCGRGVSFEIDLEGEGSIRAPNITTKNFVEYLWGTEGLEEFDAWKKGSIPLEPETIDLSRLGNYYLKSKGESGRVSGGKGDKEAFVIFSKLGADSQYSVCIESVATHLK